MKRSFIHTGSGPKTSCLTFDQLFSNVTSVILVIRLVMFLPPATKLEQGYIFTGVCHSVNRGGLPQCMLEYHHPWSRHPRSRPPQSRPPQNSPPPGADPPEQTPPRVETPPETPPVQSILGDTVNARAVRILLECNLVFTFVTRKEYLFICC